MCELRWHGLKESCLNQIQMMIFKLSVEEIKNSTGIKVFRNFFPSGLHITVGHQSTRGKHRWQLKQKRKSCKQINDCIEGVKYFNTLIIEGSYDSKPNPGFQ
jgi:hypothetical protein